MYNFKRHGIFLKKKLFNKTLTEFISTCCNIEEQIYLEEIPQQLENKKYPFGDNQSPNSFSLYNSPNSKILHYYTKPFFEKILDKKLFLTYTYHRIYYNGAVLKPHIDRPSCQYSATVCIKKGNTDWPIFFELKNKKIVKIEMSEGDVVFYKGCELKHWREHYGGDRHTQIFLHYVDSTGSNKHFKGDNYINNITSYN